MKKGYLYIALTTLIFSTMEIAMKLCAGQFHPIQMTVTRFLAGGLILIPFAVSALKKEEKGNLMEKISAPLPCSGFSACW